jgi:caffeic acid 3-O-methyltransferase
MGTDGSSDHHAQAAQEDHHETPLRNGIVGEKDAVARDAAMRLATTMAVPAALKAAIELGVFEILAKARGAGKSLTAKEIASQVRPDSGGLSVINDRYLERILRLLASENVVRESAVTVASANSSSSTDRCYALQPVGTYFARNDEDSASVAPFIMLSQDRDFIEPWHHLSATVLDDSTDTFRKAHGESLFQYISHNPRVGKIFNAS